MSSSDAPEYRSYLKVSNAPPAYGSVEELNAYFGEFGGCFVAETLIQAHHNLIDEYVRATQDPKFRVRTSLACHSDTCAHAPCYAGD